MNNGTTGKINGSHCAKVEQKTVSRPYPVTDRTVDQNAPQGNENGIPFEINPFSKSTGNKSRSNDGKFTLEHGKHIFRNLR